MTLDGYNTFCSALAHASHVVQWGDAHVWKIGGKVFAVAHWGEEERKLLVTFKCSPLSYDLLKEQPGLQPAPYLASRGLKWIQRTGKDSMSDATLRKYLTQSYWLAASNLPKKTLRDLKLDVDAQRIAAKG